MKLGAAYPILCSYPFLVYDFTCKCRYSVRIIIAISFSAQILNALYFNKVTELAWASHTSIFYTQVKCDPTISLLLIAM